MKQIQLTPVKDESAPKDIKAEHPGILELPEGAFVEWAEGKLEKHFVSLAKKKGKAAVMKALLNLERWNKKDDPDQSKKARNIINALLKNTNWTEMGDSLNNIVDASLRLKDLENRIKDRSFVKNVRNSTLRENKATLEILRKSSYHGTRKTDEETEDKKLYLRKYIELQEKESDSVQDKAGFKNTRATSVVSQLQGAGLSTDKARALLMYHGGLTNLRKVNSAKELLRFKALRELMSESEADRVVRYLKDTKKCSKKKTANDSVKQIPLKRVIKDEMGEEEIDLEVGMWVVHIESEIRMEVISIDGDVVTLRDEEGEEYEATVEELQTDFEVEESEDTDSVKQIPLKRVLEDALEITVNKNKASDLKEAIKKISPEATFTTFNVMNSTSRVGLLIKAGAGDEQLLTYATLKGSKFSGYGIKELN